MTAPTLHVEPSDDGDERLMLRVGEGDQEAFVTLIRKYQQPMANFFRRMGDYSHEEDLTQETFIRLFKCRHTYQPKARFSTFLYVLARRVHIDHLRKTGRRREAMEQYEQESLNEREHQFQPPPDGAAEECERLLGVLSDAMRSVVVMIIYQGLTHQEIADILGIPLGTVKTRYFHALKIMKEALRHE